MPQRCRTDRQAATLRLSGESCTPAATPKVLQPAPAARSFCNQTRYQRPPVTHPPPCFACTKGINRRAGGPRTGALFDGVGKLKRPTRSTRVATSSGWMASADAHASRAARRLAAPNLARERQRPAPERRVDRIRGRFHRRGCLERCGGLRPALRGLRGFRLARSRCDSLRGVRSDTCLPRPAPLLQAYVALGTALHRSDVLLQSRRQVGNGAPVTSGTHALQAMPCAEGSI